MGLSKKAGLYPPSSFKLEGLKLRITEMMENVTQDMLQRVWQEMG